MRYPAKPDIRYPAKLLAGNPAKSVSSTTLILLTLTSSSSSWRWATLSWKLYQSALHSPSFRDLHKQLGIQPTNAKCPSSQPLALFNQGYNKQKNIILSPHHFCRNLFYPKTVKIFPFSASAFREKMFHSVFRYIFCYF